ncbi:hypothetical protein [Streptomyces sp. S.PNR 29]|uniref:hypothetical protein n=1 Tax=Streptomyces sp. S.PNR 29 TaxID=2973805 RepID=UPI0025B05301|nr:hypothetical protein [Streptomyces sp. S.PNR 29]MDN0195443.1 hypothetical protein [Streptomyces sp. S.PNR 29]
MRRELKPMKTRRACLAAALLTAVALAGCQDSDAGAAAVPDGWGTLKTKGVDVSYPSGYREQSDGERSKYNAAAAERTENGKTVSVITVQLGFTQADSAEQAAIAAEAGIQMGADVKGQKDVELAGTEEARRIDFTFESTGEDGGPPEGTPIEGVILTGLDSSDTTFAIRVDAARGELSDTDLEKIVKSVEVH